ncbi:MAG TPA: hypothetical protein DCE52_13150 [Rhodobacteraceae bacterium]|nr:hypothetical protein [Paracoccaceae bacterium]
MLKFDDGTMAGGTVSYDGNIGGALVGTDIVINSVTGIGTPMFDGESLDIANGKLNFITGGNLSKGPGNWEFASGGSFTLTGGIVGLTDSGSGAVVPLLSGSFGAVPVNPGLSGNGSVFVFNGFGIDTKDNDMTGYFGIDPNLDWDFASTAISFDITTFDDNSLSPTYGKIEGTVNNADIVNAVPDESTTVALLGLGLAGLGAIARRRK